MRGPQPPPISLSDAERQALEHLMRGHRTPQQLALRARVILAAADGANNSQIARQEGVTPDTVRLWRARWLGLQAVSLADLSVDERLTDAPRPGKPAGLQTNRSAKSWRWPVKLPTQAGRPLSQWTGTGDSGEIIAAALSPDFAAPCGAAAKKGASAAAPVAATG